MGFQLRDGPVWWVRDLNASTSTTVFPSASTDGIALPTTFGTGRAASKIHVGVDMSVSGGTLSCFVSVYGYATSGTLNSAPRWFHIGTMNSGSAMAANGATHSSSANTLTRAETFSISGENYERFATRSIAPGGTSPVVSTYIGFPLE